MAYNSYRSEKLAEAHRQDLVREAALQRLAVRLPRRRSLSRRVAPIYDQASLRWICLLGGEEEVG